MIALKLFSLFFGNTRVVLSQLSKSSTPDRTPKLSKTRIQETRISETLSTRFLPEFH